MRAKAVAVLLHAMFYLLRIELNDRRWRVSNIEFLAGRRRPIAGAKRVASRPRIGAKARGRAVRLITGARHEQGK